MTKQEYLAKRTTLFEEAQALLDGNKPEECEAKLKEVETLDAQYEAACLAQANINAMKDSTVPGSVQDLQTCGTGIIDKLPEAGSEARKIAEDRGNALKMRNTVTVGSSNILMPKHQATDIRPAFNPVSSLIDRVSVKPLIGGESFQQPYVAGYGDADYSTEGSDYNSAEATFGYADINKAKVTAYAEDTEEVEKLPAADYDAEVMKGVTIASRKKISREILVGTGATNHIAGIFSTAATAIDAATDISIAEIDEMTLDEIVFSYGGDEEVEDAAVLILNKVDLKAFATLRDADGKKIYDVKSNGNTGTIDGIPFVINSACKAISAAATGTGNFAMAYGPLSNYLLTVFSDTDVQRSTDYQFKKGMIAHKASTFVGGNVVSKNGFLRIKKG